MSRTTILLKSRTMTSTRSSAEMSSPRSVSTSRVLCFAVSSRRRKLRLDAAHREFERLRLEIELRAVEEHLHFRLRRQRSEYPLELLYPLHRKQGRLALLAVEHRSRREGEPPRVGRNDVEPRRNYLQVRRREIERKFLSGRCRERAFVENLRKLARRYRTENVGFVRRGQSRELADRIGREFVFASARLEDDLCRRPRRA